MSQCGSGLSRCQSVHTWATKPRALTSPPICEDHSDQCLQLSVTPSVNHQDQCLVCVSFSILSPTTIQQFNRHLVKVSGQLSKQVVIGFEAYCNIKNSSVINQDITLKTSTRLFRKLYDISKISQHTNHQPPSLPPASPSRIHTVIAGFANAPSLRTAKKKGASETPVMLVVGKCPEENWIRK